MPRCFSSPLPSEEWPRRSFTCVDLRVGRDKRKQHGAPNLAPDPIDHSNQEKKHECINLIKRSLLLLRLPFQTAGTELAFAIQTRKTAIFSRFTVVRRWICDFWNAQPQHNRYRFKNRLFNYLIYIIKDVSEGAKKSFHLTTSIDSQFPVKSIPASKMMTSLTPQYKIEA